MSNLNLPWYNLWPFPQVLLVAWEAKLLLITTSLHEVVEYNEVSSEPPLLQTEQPKLSHLLLIRFVLQTPHQFRCPSLDVFQGLNVFLVVKGPKTEHST